MDRDLRGRYAVTSCVLLLCLAWSPGLLQGASRAPAVKRKAAPPSATTASKAPTIKVQDTKTFFQWFVAMKEKWPQRSQFETEEQYRKRLPPPFDSSKIVYIRADGCRYKYDIETQRLAVFAGRHGSFYFREDEGVADISVYSESRRTGTYTARNAFGTIVTVTKRTDIYCRLRILNAAEWSGMIVSCGEEFPDDELASVSDSRIFKITITRPPAAAKRLANSLEVIFGVKMPGYEHSSARYSWHDPTFHAPSDSTSSTYAIDARLVKIIVREKSSQEILAEHDVAPRVSPQGNDTSTKEETVPGDNKGSPASGQSSPEENKSPAKDETVPNDGKGSPGGNEARPQEKHGGKYI